MTASRWLAMAGWVLSAYRTMGVSCSMQVDAPGRKEQLVLLEGALGAATIGMDEVRGRRGGCTEQIEESRPAYMSA